MRSRCCEREGYYGFQPKRKEPAQLGPALRESYSQRRELVAGSGGVVPLVGFGHTVAWINDGTHLDRLALRRNEQHASRCARLQWGNAEGFRYDQLTVLVPNADRDGGSGLPLEPTVFHGDGKRLTNFVDSADLEVDLR